MMKNRLTNISILKYKFIILPVFLTLVACGGAVEEENTDNLIWVKNSFKSASVYKNLCKTPRTGSNPFTNRAYPDKAGSTLHENFWLRSWSNNTYLWYDEIIDQNPDTFSSAIEYFKQLITPKKVASGKAKDRFHFTFDSDKWQQLTQSGISSGYGVEWSIINSAPPRKILVAYTEPNTPATNVNLSRGAEILEVDGVDVVNANDQASVDIINSAFFPQKNGQTHTFKIKEVGQVQTRIINMTSTEITSAPVQNVKTINTTTGKVGYLFFSTHIATAETQLIDAINLLRGQGVNDLVLDLRYNSGGLLAVASELSYMIAGFSATNNRVFDRVVFNNKHQIKNPVTGKNLVATPFYNTTLGFSVNAGQTLPSLNLNRVFILSSKNTCSASEAIINGLRGVNVEVILIGDTTCGKPYGFYPTDNCGTSYFTVQFRGENAKGFGDYSEGFSPENTIGITGQPVKGCSVADDYQNKLGDENEGQLKTALNYRATKTCPAPLPKTSKKQALSETDKEAIQVHSPIQKALILENSILTRH